MKKTREPYPGMPAYGGEWLDSYLGRPWGWSEPELQRQFREKHGNHQWAFPTHEKCARLFEKK